MNAADAADAGALRVVVTHGNPDDAELAAVVAALLSSATPRRADPAVPAWRRAALVEGTGGARVTARGAADTPDRPRW